MSDVLQVMQCNTIPCLGRHTHALENLSCISGSGSLMSSDGGLLSSNGSLVNGNGI